MLESVLNSRPYQPRKSAIAAMALSALLCVTPVSLVHAQLSSRPIPSGSGQKPTVAVLTHRKASHRTATVAKAATPKPHVASPVKATRVANVFTLEYAKAGTTAALLKQVFKSADVVIGADDRTNQLVVRGDTSAVTQVETVVNKLDQPTPEEAAQIATRKLHVYKVRNGNASEMASVLYGSLAAHNAASITVDSRTNSLIVTADDKRQVEIDRLIKELDTEVHPSRDSQSVLTVFQIRYAKALQVAQLVNRSSPQDSALRASADEYSNSVVVNCRQDELPAVRDLLRQIDIPRPGQ